MKLCMKFRNTILYCFIQIVAWKKKIDILKYKKMCIMSLHLQQTDNHKERLKTTNFFPFFFNQKKFRNKSFFSSLNAFTNENMDNQVVQYRASTHLVYSNIGFISKLASISVKRTLSFSLSLSKFKMLKYTARIFLS